MGMATDNVTAEPMRVWLGRVAVAVVIGLLAGVIAYLTARAIGSAWLLLSQQALVEATRLALQEGVMGLANTNLRALRLAAEAQQRAIAELSEWIGLGVALAASIIAFVRLELQASK